MTTSRGRSSRERSSSLKQGEAEVSGEGNAAEIPALLDPAQQRREREVMRAQSEGAKEGESKDISKRSIAQVNLSDRVSEQEEGEVTALLEKMRSRGG